MIDILANILEMIIIHELGNPIRRSCLKHGMVGPDMFFFFSAVAEVKGSAEDLHQKEDTFVAGLQGHELGN